MSVLLMLYDFGMNICLIGICYNIHMLVYGVTSSCTNGVVGYG